jgi:hypothetical protein
MAEKMNELVYIQSNLKAPKNQFNSFGNYKYRSCEDILEAVKPLLKEVNCVLTIGDEIEVIGNRIYVKATAQIETSDGRVFVNSAFAREPESKKGMDESQVTGMASSYARKYALNGLFCIDDTRDADTMDNSESPKATAKKATATKSEAPATKSETPASPVNAPLQISETLKKAIMGCKSMDELKSLYLSQPAESQKNQNLISLVNAKKDELLKSA